VCRVPMQQAQERQTGGADASAPCQCRPRSCSCVRRPAHAFPTPAALAARRQQRHRLSRRIGKRGAALQFTCGALHHERQCQPHTVPERQPMAPRLQGPHTVLMCFAHISRPASQAGAQRVACCSELTGAQPSPSRQTTGARSHTQNSIAGRMLQVFSPRQPAFRRRSHL